MIMAEKAWQKADCRVNGTCDKSDWTRALVLARTGKIGWMICKYLSDVRNAPKRM